MNYRWNIYLVNLNPTVGSEQGKTRPVLVISDDDINAILPVINSLPLTSHKQGRKIYPNEVLLPKEQTTLDKDSIVLWAIHVRRDNLKLSRSWRSCRLPTLAIIKYWS